jgi:hypothetical protein
VAVAFDPVTVQAWFETTAVDIEPGSSIVLKLTVSNLDTATDSFSLAPVGMAAAWATVRPAYITLFGGAQSTVEVEVHTPRLSSTTAGPVSLGVRIVPHKDPDDVALAEITLLVAPTFDRRLTILQPALRSRRRAVYEMLVENKGNLQAHCQLHLIDPTGRLDGRFDPPAAGVEPGGTTVVRLHTVALHRQWDRRSRTIPFRVEADEQGAPSAAADGTFVQAPMVPERLGSRVLAAALTMGLIALGWFAVVRPAIDDAADRAVAERTGEVTATTVPAPTGSTVPDQAVSGGGETPTGDLFSKVLAPVGPINQPTTDEIVVPDGKRLLVTDYLIQNPFGDAGEVKLSIGTIELRWDLSVQLDGTDVGFRFSSPVEVKAGEKVTFQVVCRVVGLSGGSACGSTALISGTLVDA